MSNSELIQRVIAIGTAIASTNTLRARQLNALIPEIQRLERRKRVSERALRFAVGMLSTTDGYSNRNPEEIYYEIRQEALKEES